MNASGNRPKIVVTNRIFDDSLRRLSALGDVVVNREVEPWSRKQLMAHAADADALMAFMTDEVDESLLEACPRLRIVAGALKGYDNFDADACSARGVWLSIVPDLLTNPTAELAVALTLGLNRHLMAGDGRVRSGSFRGWRPELYGFGLDGANVGIAGLGRVGIETARRLQGFGCGLFGFDAMTIDQAQLDRLSITRVGWDRLLGLCDVIILALPLNERTLHLVDVDALKRVRCGARLINVGRGSVVDEAAVVWALSEGRLAGYAADVFEFEDWSRAGRPRTIPSGLLSMADRTLFTPHLGSAVTGVRKAIEMAAVDNIEAVLAGEAPPHAVNSVPVRAGCLKSA